MARVVFSRLGEPIKDHLALAAVRDYLLILEQGGTVWVSNILVFNMLRAEILSWSQDSKNSVEWFHENQKVDMDQNMRSEEFWNLPNTNLWDETLERLL